MKKKPEPLPPDPKQEQLQAMTDKLRGIIAAAPMNRPLVPFLAEWHLSEIEVLENQLNNLREEFEKALT